jgi:hypothetical protein
VCPYCRLVFFILFNLSYLLIYLIENRAHSTTDSYIENFKKYLLAIYLSKDKKLIIFFLLSSTVCAYIHVSRQGVFDLICLQLLNWSELMLSLNKI